MSTLQERLSSLRQARELLQAASAAPTLSAGAQTAAMLALRDYPADADIDKLLDVEDLDRVQAWGWSLALTRAAIEELFRGLPLDEPMRRWALAVERHFPEMSYLPADEGEGEWTAVFLDPMRQLVKKKMKSLDIRLEGRRWTGGELARHNDLPGRLEMANGLLCLDDAQRMLLLEALLEHVGTARAVTLGPLDAWTDAVDLRKRAEGI